MRRSKNPDTIRSNLWRDNNPEKVLAGRLKSAYRLLVKHGIIDGCKVLHDPTKL